MVQWLQRGPAGSWAPALILCQLSLSSASSEPPWHPVPLRPQRPSLSPLLLNHHSSKAGGGHRPGLLGILVVTRPAPPLRPVTSYLFFNHNFFHLPQAQSRLRPSQATCPVEGLPQSGLARAGLGGGPPFKSLGADQLWDPWP